MKAFAKSGPGLTALMRALCIGACVSFAQPAAALGDSVYLIGPGASVYDLFDEVLADHAQRAKNPFWVIVSGRDIRRVTKAGASREIDEMRQRIHARNGLIYVCRSDMAFYGVRNKDLLDGIRPVRGYGEGMTGAGLRSHQKDIPLPEDAVLARHIFKACQDRRGPDARAKLWSSLDRAAAKFTRLT